MTSTMLSDIRTVDIDAIRPSPENDELYGAIDMNDHELIELALDIRQNGLREPIRVSTDSYIVSGHRRYAACRLLGLDAVSVTTVGVARYEHDERGWKQELAKWNLQRVKSASVRLREAMLGIDPDVAYQELQQRREASDASVQHAGIKLGREKKRSKISGGKQPMLDAALRVIESLKDFWPVSVRQVHYGLLNDPPLMHASKPKSTYKNDRNSYQDLCDILTRARLTGDVPIEAIDDETRPTRNLDFDDDVSQFTQREFGGLLAGYRRDLLQSQADHVELVIEKLTALNIVQPVAKRFTMPLTVGRGYCSIGPRHDIVQRYRQSGKDRLILLVVSDFDPDGDAIAHSLARSLRDDFQVSEVKAYKAMLTRDQVRDWQLPPNDMVAKRTSANFKKFVAAHGSTDVYELEAIPPTLMQAELDKFIRSAIDLDAYNAEVSRERYDARQIAAIRRQVVEFTQGLDLDN